MSLKLKIRKPDDMHVHLRGGNMLSMVARFTANSFGRALVMPNVPAIVNAQLLGDYREQILRATTGTGFRPLMTLKLTPMTTTRDVELAHAAGCTAVKVYPAGVTTGSHDGPTLERLRGCDHLFDCMQDLGMVLCWHGEHPGYGVLDAEPGMLPEIQRVVDGFPRLRQVLEHLSTAAAVDWVRMAPERVSATITVHHLLLSIDDVFGRGHWSRDGRLNPHHFCWPVPKTAGDREALLEAATSGNRKFFLGTDSAPHLIANKLGTAEADTPGRCCAGLFTAPVVLPALTYCFAMRDALEALEPFTSQFGAEFYGLELNSEFVELERDDWLIPEMACGGRLVPFLAGEVLPWRMVQ